MAGRRIHPWVAPVAAVAFLVLATWLYVGYRYGVSIQPAFLASVLRYRGDLDHDWFTGFPAAHWAVDHALALVPDALLPAAVLALWLAFLAILWASFLAICASLRAPLIVGVAAGLALIPTRVGGFGVSEVLFDFFYPNGLALALALGALALLLRERFAPAGAVLGLSVVVHPGLGPLAVVAIAPVALVAGGRFELRSLVRFAIPLALLGIPALIQVLSAQAGGGRFSAHEQYDFIAIVRNPQHVLYSSFPGWEYTRTALWGAGLIASCLLLWRLRAARLLLLLAATMIVLFAVGAIAGESGGPMLLVNAQTSRLSALVVVLGVAGLAAGLTRTAGAGWAAAALLGAFLLAPPVARALGWSTRYGTALSATEAVLLLLAFAVALVAARLGSAERMRLSPSLERYGVAALLAVAVVSMAVEHGTRKENMTAEGDIARASPEEDALKEVADAARRATEPDQLVLGSPDMDGLRYWAERPDVVEWGVARFGGDGDVEWRRRVLDLTGDPRILDPDAFGTDIAARAQAMARGYQAEIGRSPRQICRYHASVVVARPLARTPPG